jgi:hypothetical protein
MTVPYETLHEQLADVIALAGRRLEALASAQAQTAPGAESARELESRREERLRRRCEATVDAGGTAPLEYLFRIFHLTDFERHCVYLALAAELDNSLRARCASLAPESGRLPGLELCLSTFPALPEARSDLLADWRTHRETMALFFRSGLGGADGQSDLTAGLKLDGRILDFLLDEQSGDPELEGCAQLLWPGDDPASLVFRGETLEKLRAYDEAAPSGSRLLFCLRGDAGSGRKTLVRHLCRLREQSLLVVNLEELARDSDHWWTRVRAVCRETAIRHAVLAFTGLETLLGSDSGAQVLREDGTSPEPRRDAWYSSLSQLMDRAARVTDRLVFLTAAAWPPELACGDWQRLEVVLEPPDAGQRILLWQHALEGADLDKDADLSALAVKFALQPAQIAAAAAEARRLALWNGAERVNDGVLHQACRAQLSHRLGKMASRVNAAYTWDDLILPPEQKERLRNACAQVEYRHRIYDQWGFGKKVAYGQGVSMLFSGPPGTGKTMAAQVIANRLQLELYKVDLSGVLSKYIGETEKQLGAVFDEVKKSQSILFFDEADALFGKRSETKDSHDRYANVQTSYLLQKIEEYDGVVILASNFLQNFDEAFKRRIKFIIDFTLPDQERRELIWRSVLPAELPRDEDLDFDFLARSFELSGSSIKNIAVAAAFLAAEENAPLGMAHLLTAVQTEQNKAGKNLGREEFGEYYHQVQTYRESCLNRREHHADK